MTTFLHKLLLLLVILAPLPLGSNREWSWTLCAFIAAVITLGWVLKALARPQQVSRSLGLPVIVLFLVVCAWAWLQTVAWVPVEWKHPLWAMNTYVQDWTLPGSISLSPQDSLIALMRLLSYGLVFFLAFQFGRDRERALASFWWIAFAGFAYAIYGLIVFWGEFGTLFWFFDEDFKSDVRGTFVNRNSFATYLGLSLLCAIAVFNQKVARRGVPVGMLVGREIRIERFILLVWKPLIAILLMTTALVLTHSRGGFFSTLAGLLVLLFLLNKRQQGGTKSKAALAGAVAVSVLAFVLTSEVLLQRIDRLTADAPGRLQVYEMTAEAIDDNPLLGFGYGTYSDSFRLYRDDSLSAHYDKTHNTYLENIFELGWPVAALLFLCIAWLTLLCFRGALNRGRDWVYPATGAATTVLVAIHSFFDFSLQMPGIAITYACILGIGCAQSYSSRSA